MFLIERDNYSLLTPKMLTARWYFTGYLRVQTRIRQSRTLVITHYDMRFTLARWKTHQVDTILVIHFTNCSYFMNYFAERQTILLRGTAPIFFHYYLKWSLHYILNTIQTDWLVLDQSRMLMNNVNLIIYEIWTV